MNTTEWQTSEVMFNRDELTKFDRIFLSIMEEFQTKEVEPEIACQLLVSYGASVAVHLGIDKEKFADTAVKNIVRTYKAMFKQ